MISVSVSVSVCLVGFILFFQFLFSYFCLQFQIILNHSISFSDSFSNFPLTKPGDSIFLSSHPRTEDRLANHRHTFVHSLPAWLTLLLGEGGDDGVVSEISQIKMKRCFYVTKLWGVLSCSEVVRWMKEKRGRSEKANEFEIPSMLDKLLLDLVSDPYSKMPSSSSATTSSFPLTLLCLPLLGRTFDAVSLILEKCPSLLLSYCEYYIRTASQWAQVLSLVINAVEESYPDRVSPVHAGSDATEVDQVALVSQQKLKEQNKTNQTNRNRNRNRNHSETNKPKQKS